MNFLRLLPVIISIVLLAAHFVRAGENIYAYILLFLLLLLMIRNVWVPRLMQVILLLGAVEWLYTLYQVAQVRMAHGMPTTRLALILGAVALLTAASGLVFWSQGLRKRYSGEQIKE